jgi:hypothetical protein
MFLFQSKPREKGSSVLLNPLHVLPEEQDSAAQKELEIQRSKWDTFLQSRPNIWNEEWLWMNRLVPTDNGGPIKKKFMQMFNSKTKLRKRVKSLIRSGVPPELRGDVWYACAGAATKMKSCSRDQQYPELVKHLHELDNTLIAVDIEKDLLRTFPEKICAEDKKLVDTLRRLLRAYALRNPVVGYCQSMNYICALLLFHMEEERAFWTFASLLEDILPNDYYIPSLIGGRIDQQVFQSCVAWKLPKVHEAFRTTNTVLEPIICPWFMCLYVNVLPIYAVCRVWDCLFWEGSVVLFRIGLTLVKSKSNEIIRATDFIGVYSVLKGSHVKSHSFELEISPENQIEDTATIDRSVMSDAEFLIQSAFGYRWLRSVPKQQVEVLREKFSTLLKEEEIKRKAASNESSTSPTKSEGTSVEPSRRARNRKSELMSM